MFPRRPCGLALSEEPTDYGGQDDPVLSQPRRAVADDLAGEHLERCRGVEHQLHDPTPLLFGDAHRHPLAVGDDGHEDQDDESGREQAPREPRG